LSVDEGLIFRENKPFIQLEAESAGRGECEERLAYRQKADGEVSYFLE
jgi:hypothetical protein